jgi:hypothetical protein
MTKSAKPPPTSKLFLQKNQATKFMHFSYPNENNQEKKVIFVPMFQTPLGVCFPFQFEYFAFPNIGFVSSRNLFTIFILGLITIS